jgi:hypothetical protein
MPQPNTARRVLALTASFIHDVSEFLGTGSTKITFQHRRGLIGTVLVVACILMAVGAMNGQQLSRYRLSRQMSSAMLGSSV